MSDLPGLLDVIANNTASEVRLNPETLAVLLYALDKVSNPKTWKDDPFEYMSDADIELIHELVDLAADDIMRQIVLPEPIYPKQFMCFGQTAKLVGAGVLQNILGGGIRFAQYTRVQTPYINQEYEFEVLLAKGNWIINYMAFTNNSSGQIRLRVDRVNTVFISDYYTAVQAVDITSVHAIPIAIATDGIHTVGFKSEAKNAASTNYNFFMQAVWGVWVST